MCQPECLVCASMKYFFSHNFGTTALYILEKLHAKTLSHSNSDDRTEPLLGQGIVRVINPSLLLKSSFGSRQGHCLAVEIMNYHDFSEWSTKSHC